MATAQELETLDAAGLLPLDIKQKYDQAKQMGLLSKIDQMPKERGDTISSLKQGSIPPPVGFAGPLLRLKLGYAKDAQGRFNILKDQYGEGNVQVDSRTRQLAFRPDPNVDKWVSSGAGGMDIAGKFGALPSFGGMMVGGLLGAEAGPPGAISGAGVGNMSGEEYRRFIANKLGAQEAPISKAQGAVNFATGAASEAIPRAGAWTVGKAAQTALGGAVKDSAKAVYDYFGKEIDVNGVTKPLLTIAQATKNKLAQFMNVWSKEALAGGKAVPALEEAQGKLIAGEAQKLQGRMIAPQATDVAAKLGKAAGQWNQIIAADAQKMGEQWGHLSGSMEIGSDVQHLTQLSQENYKRLGRDLWTKFAEKVDPPAVGQAGGVGPGTKVMGVDFSNLAPEFQKALGGGEQGGAQIPLDKAKSLASAMTAKGRGVGEAGRIIGEIQQSNPTTFFSQANGWRSKLLERARDLELAKDTGTEYGAAKEMANTLENSIATGLDKFDRTGGATKTWNGLRDFTRQGSKAYKNNFNMSLLSTAEKDGNDKIAGMLFNRPESGGVTKIGRLQTAFDPNTLSEITKPLRGTSLESDAAKMVDELKKSLPADGMKSVKGLLAQNVISESMVNGSLDGTRMLNTMDNKFGREVIEKTIGKEQTAKWYQLADTANKQQVAQRIANSAVTEFGTVDTTALRKELSGEGRKTIAGVYGPETAKALEDFLQVDQKNTLIRDIFKSATRPTPDNGTVIDGGKLQQQIMALGEDTRRNVLGEANADKLMRYSQAVKAMQDPTEPFGKWMVRFSQISAGEKLAGAIGAGVGSRELEKTGHPKSAMLLAGAAGASIVSPYVFGRMLTSPEFTDLVLQGMKQPIENESKTLAISKAMTALLQKYGQDSRRVNTNSTP